MTDLGYYYSSPGMVSEGFTLLRAEGLTKVGEGGGVEGEDIIVHRVPLAELPGLRRGEARGGLRDRRQAAAAAGRRDALIAPLPLQGRGTMHSMVEGRARQRAFFREENRASRGPSTTRFASGPLPLEYEGRIEPTLKLSPRRPGA